MSLAVRVIPCLDVDAGRVVKGVHFENLRDAGDPVELAAEYYRQGADELTFLDVTASSSHRQTMVDVVSRTAEQIFIPLTVGGGVRTPEDVDSLLRCGADKVGVNTAAINDPTSSVVSPNDSAIRCLCCPSMHVANRENDIRSQVSKSPPWAGANPLALTPFGGSSAPKNLVRGRFSLIQWMPMAPNKASIWR
mgnify:FL=1